ncbi:sensor histidine kinase KdpD [Pseudaminobacter arsenicus]|uniref:histidine kinase n=1 Tax=Borborobacter arsenicus TaxID=1851146 RepID=A0A432V652_9HYPH|nr:sensor histidine kinase KdpD [Pseudaminobacter arsenicus]RUM97640.1 sensor histidine kinase KdpD [Pseudaminobacter arsenicus]
MSDQSMQDKRPSPEALLEEAARETRGRLKIFLGAAPGVGKTYEMLLSAAARRRDGVDVAIGIVETHGREETQALVEGFEVIPRKRVDYKGRTLEEMDLEAILQRAPQLVLVDELAHTNAAGGRHPKRHMDVEDLLAAGIDVYTTVNIQHLESLNDVVAQITRIRVRETVPDAFVDQADEIEVIDITPGDLIQRLKEGKVYVPKTAHRALTHYFSPGNLTALRELALRRTAQRVDQQLLTHMQAHAISGPWAAGDRVLVVINEHPKAAALLRYARRLAERLRAPWVALYVETQHALRLSEAERDRIADAMRLAERLGGEAVTIPGGELANDILRYAEANNFSHLVIGRTKRSRLYEMFFGSVTYELVRSAGNIAVHVVTGQEHEQIGAKTVATRPVSTSGDPWSYLVSTGLVGAALGVGLVLTRILEVQNVALVFFASVLVSAVAYGLWPALFVSALSVLAFNFFFLPPLYTFTISDPENVVALFFFLVVALIASNLTANVRRQAMVARRRAKTTEDLYLFSRKLAGIASLDDLLWVTASQVASMLQVRVVLFLPDNGPLALKAAWPPEDVAEEADLAAAKWCWESNKPAGRGADTLPGARRLFLPMRTGRGPVAVIGIDSDKTGPILDPDQRRLLDALTDQAALAIERVNLAEDVDRAERAAEKDRLRSALLTSISHDLRTPLASILGAAASLRTLSGLSATDREELLSTIQEESERLNRFIANLLDMTRLESGAIAPNMSLLYIGEIVASALRRAEKILAGHRIERRIAADLPMVKLDAVLFEQVLFNLLDNASKYAPPNSTIRIQSWSDGTAVHLQVLDEGDGIPKEDLPRIFDKFYRVRKSDSQRAGTGLGLAICRGFVEAMGGLIEVANRSDRSGAVFTITLPVPAEQPETEAA